LIRDLFDHLRIPLQIAPPFRGNRHFSLLFETILNFYDYLIYLWKVNESKVGQKTIAVICFYFGGLPEWFTLYFETLRRNPSIDFFFYTDGNVENYQAPNVKFRPFQLEEYLHFIKAKTGLEIPSGNPYKLCDFRPLLGMIHYEDIKSYDYYGYADIDLLFGDIRTFYDEPLHRGYDVISTHENMLSDHFILFKNHELNRSFYKNIGGWKEKISAEGVVGIGEAFLLKAYRDYIASQGRRFMGLNHWLYQFYGLKLFLKEQYSTPFSPIPWTDGSQHSAQPEEWYYQDGKITNNRDGDRNFMYLHFMNFKSSKYRHDQTPAPWEHQLPICNATTEDMRKGITINASGIWPINKKVSQLTNWSD
jgi:hypothetical protein